MKLLNLLTLSLVLAASQAQATTTVCTEVGAKGSAKKEVIVEEIADIRSQTRYGIEYDYVWKVKVQVNEIQNGKKTNLKTFEAVATAADVNYDIDAKKKSGFEFWRYNDEENQDGFSLKSSDGKETTYRLNCTETY